MMDSNSLSMVIIFVLVSVVLAYAKNLLQSAEKRGHGEASLEPPRVPPPVPYIGHLIGIFWFGNHYYTKLWYATPVP